MSFIIRVDFYKPLPLTDTITVEQFHSYIDKFLVDYGVKWNTSKRAPTSGVSTDPENSRASKNEINDNGNVIKRRRKCVTYLWYKVYYCYKHGGKPADSNDRGGVSGNIREIQKASVKTGCKAQIKIICLKSNPDVLSVSFTNEHNHGGTGTTMEDFADLPLSERMKNLIHARLEEGYHCRDVRSTMQRNIQVSNRLQFRVTVNIRHGWVNYNNYNVVHRDQIIDGDMVYNEYKKIEEKKYKRHDDQATSIRGWLQELEEAQFNTFIGATFENDFTFGFMSPWQKNLLLQCRFVCLDATHKTSNLPRCLLYTIVVRHPITGTGCPVAYMFTTDNGASPVVRFLTFLKDNGVTSLEKITIDVSNVELDAINTVYPEVQVQWCLFHVARAWVGKIREHITATFSKTFATQLNNYQKDEIKKLNKEKGMKLAAQLASNAEDAYFDELRASLVRL